MVLHYRHGRICFVLISIYGKTNDIYLSTMHKHSEPMPNHIVNQAQITETKISNFALTFIQEDFTFDKLFYI